MRWAWSSAAHQQKRRRGWSLFMFIKQITNSLLREVWGWTDLFCSVHWTLIIKNDEKRSEIPNIVVVTCTNMFAVSAPKEEVGISPKSLVQLSPNCVQVQYDVLRPGPLDWVTEPQGGAILEHTLKWSLFLDHLSELHATNLMPLKAWCHSRLTIFSLRMKLIVQTRWPSQANQLSGALDTRLGQWKRRFANWSKLQIEAYLKNTYSNFGVYSPMPLVPPTGKSCDFQMLLQITFALITRHETGIIRCVSSWPPSLPQAIFSSAD